MIERLSKEIEAAQLAPRFDDAVSLDETAKRVSVESLATISASDGSEGEAGQKKHSFNIV